MKKTIKIIIILLIIYTITLITLYFYDIKEKSIVIKINNIKMNYSSEVIKETKIIPLILDIKKTTKIKTIKEQNITDQETFNLSLNTKINNIKIIKDNKQIYNDKLINDLSKYINEDGIYKIEIKRKVKINKFITKNIKYVFILNIDIPLVFNISKNEIKQGYYLYINVSNISKSDNISINFNEEELICYKEFNTCSSYISIPITLKQGEYKINIKNNDELVKEYNINVLEENFEKQTLTIDQNQIDTKRNDEALIEFRQIVLASRNNPVLDKMWGDNFLMPIIGKITTEFGIYRYTNNNINPTRHYGIDISASKGTNIQAFSNGKIKIARLTIMAGNMIIIDHGVGLYTHYLHLDTINVNEGDIVKQGDIIGTVGSTGFSTGAHLDFAVLFNQTYTNPWQFINR